MPMVSLLILPLAALVVVGIKVTDPGLMLLGYANYLAGAFVEEAIFRGVVLRALLPGGRSAPCVAAPRPGRRGWPAVIAWERRS